MVFMGVGGYVDGGVIKQGYVHSFGARGRPSMFDYRLLLC